MAFYDTYTPTEYNVPFDVSDGEHGITIQKAECAKTKNFKEMIVVTMNVDNAQGMYTERYVEGDFFNANITKFSDAFSILRGNFNFASWKGKRGAGLFEHKTETFEDSYGNEKTVTKARMKTLIVPETNSAGMAPFNAKESKGINEAFSGQAQTPSATQNAAQGTAQKSAQQIAATPEQLAELKALFAKTLLDGTPVLDEAHKNIYRVMAKEKGIANAIASCKKYIETQTRTQTYDIDF